MDAEARMAVRTLLRGGQVIDGVSDEPVFGDVLVEGGLVAYAGPSCPEDLAEGARVVELAGRTVMPGLFDCHVHLTMYGETDNLRNVLFNVPAYNGIRAAANAGRMLDAGITTIRCMGDPGDVDYALKRAVAEGVVRGPRILASGQAITITGGHGDQFPGQIQLPALAEICDGEGAVVRAVRDRVKNGADNIKLMATGGGTSPGPATVSQLDEGDMRAAVREAAKSGKVTAAHAIGTEGIKNALRAGVRTIEHGSFLDDEGVDLLLEHGAYLCSTLAAFSTIKFGPGNGLSQETFDKVTSFKEEHVTWLRRAVERGVRVITGTDCGTPYNYPGENAQELVELARYAMTPMQAIRAATSVAAEALMQDDTGSLVPGKTADLIVVDGDPLADISVIADPARIELVMRDGVVLKGTL